MLRFVPISVAGASILAAVLLTAGTAAAHGIVGKRLFIEPLATEDANPKNELDFPVLEAIQGPEGHHVDFNYSIEKVVFPKFSVEFENSFGRFRPNETGSPASFGIGNIGLSAKYAFYKNSAHEFIMSGKFGVEMPTGDTSIGADPFTTIEPEFLYAKGFGDLPSSRGLRWLKPFAIQGDVGLDFPTGGARGDPESRFTPRADLVIEYSLPYLNQFVRHANKNYKLGGGYYRRGHSLGAIAGNLFPFSEFNFSAAPIGPGGRRALGFIRPGVVYIGRYFELGGAAEFPANTFTGRSTGGMAIFDLFIDEALPALGKMLIH